jgi:hypothetical protein
MLLLAETIGDVNLNLSVCLEVQDALGPRSSESMNCDIVQGENVPVATLDNTVVASKRVHC